MGRLLALALLAASAALALSQQYPTVYDILSAIENVVHFVADNPQKVYVDLVFGMVLAKGQIKALMHMLPDPNYRVKISDQEKVKLMAVLQRVDKEFEDVIRESRNNVIMKDDENYNKLAMRLTKAKPWERWFPLRALGPPRTRVVVENMTAYDVLHMMYTGQPTEGASDACLAEVLGEAVDAAPCDVSPRCRGAELYPGPSHGYALTHRVLYMQMAREAGCSEVGGIKVDLWINKFCSDVLIDTYALEELQLPLMTRDLYAEQVALCGFEGFLDFMTPQRIGQILSWQRPIGCFGENLALRTSLPHSRKKRDDVDMPYGCLMHFTSVCTAAIATGLRPLVEAP